jgi:hypothetical protein
VRTHKRALDMNALTRPTRVGLPAPVLRPVLSLGLETPVLTIVRAAATVLVMFLFGCRAPTAVSLRESDIEVTDARVTAVLMHHKGKRAQEPLV